MEIKTANEPTSQALATRDANALSFFDPQQFQHLQRLGLMFCKAELVPKQFQGESNLPNTVIALEMAQRLGASALAVMQQIYIVYGKPGWSSQFIIACLNTCGRFEPLRFDVTGKGDDRTCIAWTVSRGVTIPMNVRTLEQAREANLPLFEGPPCSIALAKAEGWVDKNGSKWKTMPELMLRYRAATWFGRLYAPELLMGMQSVDEIHETIDITPNAEHTDPGRETRLMSVRAESDKLSMAVDGSRSVKEEKAAETPKPEETPADPNAPRETEVQRSLRVELEKHAIEFDEFRSYLVKQLGVQNADSFASYMDVPDKLIMEEVTRSLPKIIKIYGKKGGVK